MCLEMIKRWLSSLFPPPEPETKIAWEIRVFPGKQGAVREYPNVGCPVSWLLAENESATVRVDKDNLPEGTLHDGSLFYYIAFGEKKRGWILYKADRMTLVSKVVPA